MIIPNMYICQLQPFIKVLLLVVVSLLLSLIVAEFVTSCIVAEPQSVFARKNGVEYDDRSRLQVILNCRKATENCFLSVPPNTFIGSRLKVGGEHAVLFAMTRG